MLKVPDFTSHSQQLCFGGQKLHAHVLSHALDILHHYQNQSTKHGATGQFMMVSLQEAYQEVNGMPSLDRVTALDEEVSSFLASATQNFNNTVTLLVSHRGLHAESADKFGGVTSDLAMEELLPACVLLAPQWLLDLHPGLEDTLTHNQEQVVTAFDWHATFQDGLLFPIAPVQHGRSLLSRLPAHRTCSEAQVAKRDCPCLQD